MASRAEDMPDPVLAVMADDEPAMSFDEWLTLIASDEPTEIDAEAADILR